MVMRGGRGRPPGAARAAVAMERMVMPLIVVGSDAFVKM